MHGWVHSCLYDLLTNTYAVHLGASQVHGLRLRRALSPRERPLGG